MKKKLKSAYEKIIENNKQKRLLDREYSCCFDAKKGLFVFADLNFFWKRSWK